MDENVKINEISIRTMDIENKVVKPNQTDKFRKYVNNMIEILLNQTEYTSEQLFTLSKL